MAPPVSRPLPAPGDRTREKHTLSNWADRYPRAGGPDHYAGWLENSAGFKAEIVADES